MYSFREGFEGFHEGFFFSSSKDQALRFFFMSRMRPDFVVSCAGPALYTCDDMHSSSRYFTVESTGVLAVYDILALLPSVDLFQQQ